MSFNLTEEQVLQLAPDDASKSAGRDLASSSYWSNTGYSEKALWGECKGSGKNPYKTQVDLLNIAFKCSCPSRKFPCKHGIGLLLLYTGQKNHFTTGEAPSWVNEWIEKRQDKAEKAVEKETKPIDEEARARRQEQRLKKVSSGIDELLLAIKDIVRNGIVSASEKGPYMFANLAKRMVDSQAQGLAGMMRELSEMNYYKDSWQTEFLDRLLRVYMTAASFKHIHELPEGLAEDIRSMIGFTQNTDDLKQHEGIKDEWFVLGTQTEQQEQLFVQRNWLLGRHSGQYAIVLQFYIRSQPPEFTFVPGTILDAELVFYKSQHPYRALIKSPEKTRSAEKVNGFSAWPEFLDHRKRQHILSPFKTSLPLLINSVTLANDGDQWYLNDRDGQSMLFSCEEEQLYKILAVTGGHTFDAAAISHEDHTEPLGIFSGGKYIAL